MDFSWPVYYHLTIKNQLPNVVIPGKRVRVNFSLVNELDMFRGDDILAECPIPLRVIAVPLEDPNAELGPDGKPKKHEIDAQILTRHVRVKPIIHRNGTGTVIVTINASPVLRGNEQLPFLLQFTISPKSRIFNYVVPAATKPMLICSPDSEAAKKMFEDELDDEWDDEEDEEDYEYEDEDGEEDEEEDEDEEETVAATSKAVKRNWGVGDDDEDEDDDEDFVDDDDFVEEDEDEDEDDDEDYEFDDEDDDEMGIISDDDLYEKTIAAKAEESDHEHNDDDPDLEPPIPGVYHAFVADTLTRCRPSQILADAITHPSTADAGPATATPGATPGAVRPGAPVPHPTAAPTGKTGLQVQGMQFRRVKALPPALQKKKDEEAQAQAQAQAVQPVQAAGKTGVVTGFRAEGQAETLMNANTGVTLLDPLNGVFSVNTHICASTLSARQSLQQVAYAYIKVVQGTSIGARIWDGALYLMRFLTRLTQQSQSWLDGLRVLELGAGTGVLGIWLYQMMYQRAVAQQQFVLAQLSPEVKVEVECALKALSSGDFKYASQHLNGTTEYVDSAFTVSKRAYTLAKALLTYSKPPLMAVTDQNAVFDVMRTNVSMNAGPRMDHWKQNVRKDAVTATVEGERVIIQCDDPATTQNVRPVAPASGLHVFELDWSQPLSKSILKLCGVTMMPKDKDAFLLPAAESACADAKLTAIRAQIADIYTQYLSLKRGPYVAGKDVLVTEHYLVDARHRPAFELNIMPGIDVVVASECLYNDRYFSILVETINNLYAAHEFAHAQHMDAYNHAVAKYTQWAKENDVIVDATHFPPAPVKMLPLVLLSYRLRATHEEESINETFFKVLEATGKYHTAIPLTRVLKTKEEAVSRRPTHDQVHERALQRKERENEIRNALQDLDTDRQEQTRLAVLYQCPGKDAQGNVESPIGNLSSNAAFLFKLFQAL